MLSNQHIASNFNWRQWIVFLIFIPIFGCVPTKNLNVKDNRSVANLAQQQSLENGYNAFFRGDFKQASALFKVVQLGADAGLSKKAEFAMICTQMILANTDNGIKAAIKQLEVLSRNRAVPLGDRDFQMLATSLESNLSQHQALNEPKEILDATCAYQYQESLKQKDETIDQLNKKITAIKSEVKTLENKIKSIEEIDQKIQQKKSPNQHRK